MIVHICAKYCLLSVKNLLSQLELSMYPSALVLLQCTRLTQIQWATSWGVTSYKNNTDSSGIMLNLFSKKAKGEKTNTYPCLQLCSSSNCDDFCCIQDSCLTHSDQSFFRGGSFNWRVSLFFYQVLKVTVFAAVQKKCFAEINSLLVR